MLVLATSQGAEADNAISLSYNEEDIPIGGDELPLSGAQVTSPIVDVEALVRRRNVIAPRTLFVEELVVGTVEPPSFRLAVETRMAKRAR